MRIDMNDWLRFACEPTRTLAIPIVTQPCAKLIDRRVFDVVTDGTVQSHAIEAAVTKFQPDAATMMMDLTVEAEAFGASINFTTNEVPTVAEPLLRDLDSVERLEIPSMSIGRIPQYLKAGSLAYAKIKDKPVFAGCIGPFSLAGRLFGLSETMTALCIEPDTIKLLVEKCSVFLLEYILEFKRAGLNGILMAEPAAGLLSSEMCDAFSTWYIKQIVRKVQDDNFLLILHNCGNTGQVTSSMVSSDARCLHFGNKIDLQEVLKQVPEDIVVMGNIDPVGVFKLGKPEQVFKATSALLQRIAGHENFVVSSGCDIPYDVPLDNIEAFFEAVNSFNRDD